MRASSSGGPAIPPGLSCGCNARADTSRGALPEHSCSRYELSSQALLSGRSPRIVDHETPGAVCLATQNIRILGREVHGFTARSGSSEGPIADDEGQIT